MKAISLKLDEAQLKLLDQVSEATHISKSVLVRKGIDMMLHQYKEDVITDEFRSTVSQLIADDRETLKKLAKM